jgi:hypothetical protein
MNTTYVLLAAVGLTTAGTLRLMVGGRNRRRLRGGAVVNPPIQESDGGSEPPRPPGHVDFRRA